MPDQAPPPKPVASKLVVHLRELGTIAHNNVSHGIQIHGPLAVLILEELSGDKRTFIYNQADIVYLEITPSKITQLR